MKSSPSLVTAAAGAMLVGACSSVGRHVSMPESAPNSARLVVEMSSPPPFDLASGETRQSFSASFFRKDVCRAENVIHQASRGSDNGSWVSREAATPSAAAVAVPGQVTTEFRQDTRVEVGIAAGTPVRLALIGTRQFERQEGLKRILTTRSCPGIVEFTPEAGARYVARHVWITGRCTAVVKQVTGAGSEQKEADVRVAPVCPRGVETG